MHFTRRSVLRTGVASIAGTAVAGCLSEPGGDDPETETAGDSQRSGYAALFPLLDWAGAIGGDAFDLETPVDVGASGHAWSPDGNIVLDVAETDVFFYLDSPEFRWAQQVADSLERDYEDVAVVDCLEGIEMLEWDHDGSTEHDHGDDEEDEPAHDHDDSEDDHDESDEDHDHDESDEDHDLDDSEDDHDGSGHDDESGEYDPHAWLDPVRARRMVETVASALADLDPDRADAYEANAADYEDRLTSLDDSFRDVIEAADRDLAVLAGHDSFTYLADRYDFTLHTPVGVSPNESPSQNDLVETLDLVDENEIDVILYDRFESSTLAETIVEASDASETLPLTTAAGTTETWDDRGWGYVEQMEEINLPAFERALGS